jgi:hypothetical protein
MASARGQRQATMMNIDYLNQNQATNATGLRQGADMSLAAIGSGQTAANNAIRDYGAASSGAITSGYNQARGDLSGGFARGRQDVQQGINIFNPYVKSGQAANTAQSDFLGLNGAAGSGAQAAALNTWRGATGYQDVLDQTSDAALRKASVIGGLGGNQIDAVARIGGNLANQTAQQYFGNLGNLSTQGLQAAGQQQQGYNTLGQMGVAEGTGLAGLATDRASKEAGIFSGMGSSLGNVAMQTGQNQAGIYTGLGQSLANQGNFTTGAQTQNITSQAQASDAARAANQQTMVNLGTTAFSALMGMPMGGGGGGGGGTGGMPANMGWLRNFAGT